MKATKVGKVWIVDTEEDHERSHRMLESVLWNHQGNVLSIEEFEAEKQRVAAAGGGYYGSYEDYRVSAEQASYSTGWYFGPHGINGEADLAWVDVPQKGVPQYMSRRLFFRSKSA